LTDLDQSKVPTAIKAHDIRNIKVMEKSSEIKDITNQIKKQDGVTERISEVSKAKIQHQNPQCLLEGKVVVCSAASSGRSPVNTIKHFHIKPPKATANKAISAKDNEQEKNKMISENISNKTEESKQTGNKRKSEKTTIPKEKHKRNLSEFSQQTFNKPRSSLGMHLLESVQVFHALEKKNDKNIGPSSCQALGNSSNTKGSQYSQPITSQLDTPHEGYLVKKKKFKSKPRRKIAVLTKNVHLLASMSFPHLERLSWYL
jgi:hypothetical protein